MSEKTYMSADIQKPMDMIEKNIGKRIVVKCKHQRSVTGILHAADEHLNLLLSKCEETGVADAAAPTIVTRHIPMLFVRGDLIVNFSPLLKR